MTIPSPSPTTPSVTPSTTPSGPRPDPRPLLWRAADQVDALLQASCAADLDRPTPCAEWAVRDLLAHLVAVEDRLVHLAGGGQPFETPSSVTGIADDAWLRSWREHRAPVEAALAPEEILGATFHHPAGDMPGGRAIAIYATELAVHGWDLAQALPGGRELATGGTGEPGGVGLDQSLAAALLGPMTAALPAEPRAGVPFDAVVDVPADASAYDRLAGWVGRDPAWHA